MEQNPTILTLCLQGCVCDAGTRRHADKLLMPSLSYSVQSECIQPESEDHKDRVRCPAGVRCVRVST